MDVKKGNDKFYVGDNPEDLLAEMTFGLNGTRQLIINHTMVSDELRGKGIGDQLLAEVVKYARESNRQIIPLCPFVKARFKRDENQYEDVLDKR